MVIRKTSNYINVTALGIMSILVLVKEVALYPMEQKTKLKVQSYKNSLELDLPKILAQLYIAQWIVAYTNNENALATLFNQLVEEYRYYEANLPKISQDPLASIRGGINFSMTLEEMQQTIQEKFIDMKEKGLIISQEAYQAIKHHYFALPHTDLTRIWGAEYLKKNIKQSKYLSEKYDVPDYIIVLDEIDHIKINLSFFTRLFALPLRLENGFIYFKKINGHEVASKDNIKMIKDIGIESGIGFDDFSKRGNIIQDSETHIFYIIDTEFRSFKFPMTPELVKLLNYAAARFIFLHDNFIEYDYELFF